MKIRLFPLLLALFLASIAPAAHAQALPGIDVLIARNFDVLRGKRVGLVTNQTGVTRDGRATIDVLRRAPKVKLVALFAPEHGVRGDVAAGRNVKTYRDKQSGLPVYSLYGGTKRLTAAMLRGVDVLVFDIQDIGSRSYTFISTMGECMKSCVAQKIPYIILDRPNPTGSISEGNIAREISFVAPYPIPYRHGMTMGELARWLNARRGNTCKLSVVPVGNYWRGQPWNSLELNWIATSPNVPRADSAFFYAATGILGELPGLSIGIGTPRPFELAGAPNLDAAAMVRELNQRKSRSLLPIGWNFKAVSWTPTKGRYAGQKCSGVQLLIGQRGRESADVTNINFELWAAAHKVAPQIKFFANSNQNKMFDLVCGTPTIRGLMQKNTNIDRVLQAWNDDESRSWPGQSRAAWIYDVL